MRNPLAEVFGFPVDDRSQTAVNHREGRLQLSLWDEKPGIVNVASIPQRSPFRYPSGKTWLVPYIRMWLRHQASEDKELFEVFAGGGIVTLTAIFEQLVGKATMVELDDDVAAVWQTILGGDATWLAERIMSFDLTTETAKAAIAAANQSVRDRAFATIVKNRVQRGGILAEGASFVKHGENGKGILSRWHPKTLKRRILAIDEQRERITFIHGDAFRICQRNEDRTDAAFFFDPPYVKAGRRLHKHSEIDHLALFEQAARLQGDFLMTYDDHPEICELASGYRFDLRRIKMKTTHHSEKDELLIGRNLSWLDSAYSF